VFYKRALSVSMGIRNWAQSSGCFRESMRTHSARVPVHLWSPLECNRGLGRGVPQYPGMSARAESCVADAEVGAGVGGCGSEVAVTAYSLSPTARTLGRLSSSAAPAVSQRVAIFNLSSWVPGLGRV
jgi:hypothetical protein